jgi:hypothetical protein
MRKPFFSLFVLALFLVSCGKTYDDINTPEGRRAIYEQALAHLTGGQCNEARTVLMPLYQSQWADTKVRIAMASTYACSAGFNFAGIFTAISQTSGDIWAGLVKSNYNPNASTSKVSDLKQAAAVLRTTGTSGGGLDAATRPEDANVWMILVQLQIISTTISIDTIGNANPTTGKKTVSITGKGTNQQKCDIQVAVTTISNCLSNLSNSGGTFSTIQNQLNTICGGSCGTNLDPATCTAAEQAQGAALITGIDSMWGT